MNTTDKITLRLTDEQTTALLELIHREQNTIGRTDNANAWWTLESIAAPLRTERQIRQGQAAARRVNHAGF